MPANYVSGQTLPIPHTPGSAVAAGEMVTIGSKVLICHSAIEAGQLGNLHYPNGAAMYDVPKSGAGAISFDVDDPVYLDESAQLVTDDADSGNNKQIGTCVVAAVNADTSVRIVHEHA